MKSLQSKFVLLAMVMLILTNCQDSNVSLSEAALKQSLELNQKWAYVGQKHNENLENIFNQVKRASLTSFANKQMFVDKIKSISLQSYEALSGSTDSQSGKGLEEQKAVFAANFDAQISYGSVNSNAKQSATDIYNSQLLANSDFSPELQALLNEVLAIVDNQDYSVNDVKRLLSEVQIKAIEQLKSKKEMDVLFIASSVGQASHEYWYNHIDEWIAVYKQILPFKNSDPNGRVQDPLKGPLVKGLKGADVGGAVTGALGAVFSGVGELTLGAGIALGAVVGASGASTGKFVENCWNAYFGEH